MDNYSVINIVAKAFSTGECDVLKDCLSLDCEYISECSKKKIVSSEKNN